MNSANCHVQLNVALGLGGREEMAELEKYNALILVRME